MVFSFRYISYLTQYYLRISLESQALLKHCSLHPVALIGSFFTLTLQGSSHNNMDINEQLVKEE